MSRTRNSETTVDKQGEDVEKFATKVFRWVLRQVNHHAKRGGTLLPVDVQVAVELSQYFTERDQGGKAFPSRKTLGDPLNISERTVDRSIRRMHEDDHLRVVWGKQGSKHPHQYWMVAKSEERKENGRSDARLNGHLDVCLNRHLDACLHTSETGISEQKNGHFREKTGTQAPENHYNHRNHGGDISPAPRRICGGGPTE